MPMRLRHRLAIFIIKKLIFFVADKRPLLGSGILEMIKQLAAGRAGTTKGFPSTQGIDFLDEEEYSHSESEHLKSSLPVLVVTLNKYPL